MTAQDPKVIAGSRSVFISEPAPTLADIREKITADTSLPPTRQRDLLSALSRVESLFQRKLGDIRADPPTIRGLFANASAAALGISDKTLANIRSLVVQAVRSYGEAPEPLAKRIPLSASWEALMASIKVKHHHDALRRLAAYGSAMQIAPPQVTSDTLIGLFEALEAEELVKLPRAILKNTISAWNRCARDLPDWPQTKLGSPFKKTPYTIPLAHFPASFQEDVATWANAMGNPDPFDPNAPAKALRPATIEHRVMQLRQFASALVHRDELAIDEVTKLADLFAPDRFKSAMRFFLERNDGESSACIFNFANAMRHVAGHHCHLNEAALDELAHMAKRLDPGGGRRMADHNRERLRPFDDPENVHKLLTFPETQLAKARRQANPYRAAKRVERALAVALMTTCLLRSGTLRALEWEAEFSWSRPGREGICHLIVPAHKTKSDRPLEFELPGRVADLLRIFLTEYRPNLPGAEGPYLITSPSGGMLSRQAFREGISSALKKEIGLEMHPHLFRHAVAKIAVERDPGAYLTMSRMMGHTTINTTLAHYLGTETKAAARHMDSLLQRAKNDPYDGDD